MKLFKMWRANKLWTETHVAIKKLLADYPEELWTTIQDQRAVVLSKRLSRLERIIKGK